MSIDPSAFVNAKPLFAENDLPPIVPLIDPTDGPGGGVDPELPDDPVGDEDDEQAARTMKPM